MTTKIRRLSLHEILAVFTMIIIVSPMSYGRINPIWILVISFVWVLTAWCSNGRAFLGTITDEIVMVSCIYPVLLLFLSVIRNDTVFEKRCIIDIVCVIMGVYYLKLKDKRQISFLAYTIMSYYIIMSAVTLVQLRSNIYLSRIMATDLSGQYFSFSPFTGGYGAVYSLVFLCIAMLGVIYRMRKDGLSTTNYIVILFIYSLFILKAQYVMAVLLLLMGLLLTFYDGGRWRKAFIFSIIMWFIILVIFDIISFSGIFYRIASCFPITSFFHTHLNQLGDLWNALWKGSLGDMGSSWIRLEIYKNTLDIFKNNMLWGIGNIAVEDIGNHSSVLDQLASYGILLGSVYLVTKLVMFYLIKKRIDKRIGSVYTIIILIYISFALLNNADRNEFTYVFYVLIPFLMDIYSDRKAHSGEKSYEHIFNYENRCNKSKKC